MKSLTIWMTGPSGAGNTTLAKALAEKLQMSYATEVLDLGFSK